MVTLQKKTKEFINEIYNLDDLARLRQTILKSNGRLPFPLRAGVEPTLRCNCKCEMCYQKYATNSKELGTEEIIKIFKILKNNNIKVIRLIGGEIFVRKDIFSLLQILNEEHIKTDIITNGLLLSQDQINTITSYKNIDFISFSLDGPKEVHQAIRKGSIKYEKILDNIKSAANNKIIVSIATVLNEQNATDTDFFFDKCKKLNATYICFFQEMYNHKADISKTRKLLKLDKNTEIFVNLKKPRMNFKKYTRAIKNITSIKNPPSIIIPNINEKLLKYHFSNKMRSKTKLMCVFINQIRIDPQGNVIFCPYIRESMGNIFKEDIINIWTSEKFNNMRNNIIKNNFSPICERCVGARYLPQK